MPERLARQLEFLERNEDACCAGAEQRRVDLVGTSIENIDPAGRPLNVSPMPESDLEIHWLGLLDCPIRQSSLMLRRETFAHLGIRYDPAVVSYSDYDFVVRAIQFVRAANLPEVLVQYRKHPRNTSLVRWEMFVESGARIAHGAMRLELPGFSIDYEQVAELRSVIFGYREADARNRLAAIRRAVRLYLDLFEAFAAKHRDHPLLEKLHRQVTSKAATAA